MSTTPKQKPSLLRRLLCKLGIHGPDWNDIYWGMCGEPFVRECPHCGMRWYGNEITYYSRRERCEMRGVGDWKTRKQCIKEGIWLKDKFPGQKY